MPARKPLAVLVARDVADIAHAAPKYLPEPLALKLRYVARHMPTIVNQIAAADAVLNLEPESRTRREKVAVADWPGRE